MFLVCAFIATKVPSTTALEEGKGWDKKMINHMFKT